VVADSRRAAHAAALSLQRMDLHLTEFRRGRDCSHRMSGFPEAAGGGGARALANRSAVITAPPNMCLKDTNDPTKVQTKTIRDNTITYGQFTVAQSIGSSMKFLRRRTTIIAQKRCEALRSRNGARRDQDRTATPATDCMLVCASQVSRCGFLDRCDHIDGMLSLVTRVLSSLLSL